MFIQAPSKFFLCSDRPISNAVYGLFWTCDKGPVKQFIWRIRLMDLPNVVTEVLTGSFC